MDEENLRSWVVQPDVCRCCLSTSGSWDLTASYITDAGVKEVFSEILQECYGFSLSYLSEWGPSRLVCGLCVGHLREASSFRKQVLRAEECFTEHCNNRTEPTIKNEELDSLCPDDFANESDVDYSKNSVKTETNQLTNTKPVREQCTKRKRQKTNSKTKRRKKKSTLDSDCDSDAPIAQLSKKNIASELRLEVENKESLDLEQICELKKSVTSDGNSEGIVNEGTSSKKRTKKKDKILAQNYIDNRNLRSNISLILKYSTILPFKHINNSKYICLYCDKGYLFFKELKNHVINKHFNISDKDIMACLKTPKDLIKADVSEIKCNICQEIFINLDNFVKHLIIIHNKVYNHTSRLKPSHGILGFDLSSEKLRCHICNLEFRFFKNLSVHMNEHSDNFMCHVCGKKFVSDHRLQTHVIMHRQKNILCKHCNKEFRSTSARNYHIRKVHNDSKFKCPECSEVFNQYQHRLKHLIEVHNIIKPEFKCEVCSKDFASSGGLRSHVRYSHLKTTVYTCQICGKVFVYKWIWQRHLDIHSGTKKFECKFCNKKFAQPYTLRVHEKIHLNDKKFVCTVCKAAFVQKCSLKNHVRVHHTDLGIDLNK